MRLGATAGKVCGAGGGGCFFAYLPDASDTRRRDQVRAAIEELGIRHLPFRAAPKGLEVRVTRA
jgi:mevalonate kinase